MDARTRALTRSALSAAAGVAVLYLCSLLPAGRLALLCAAGLGTAFVRMSCSWKWALGCYAVTAAAALLLLPGKMPAILYAALFGYYPLILFLTARLKKPAARWAIKLAVFNAVMFSLYFISRGLFSQFLPALSGRPPLLLLAGNAALIVYDWALQQLILYYIRNISGRIR